MKITREWLKQKLAEVEKENAEALHDIAALNSELRCVRFERDRYRKALEHINAFMPVPEGNASVPSRHFNSALRIAKSAFSREEAHD